MENINPLFFNEETVNTLSEIVYDNTKDIVILDLMQTMIDDLQIIIINCYGENSFIYKELQDIITFKNFKDFRYTVNEEPDLYYIRRDRLNIYINKVLMDVKHKSKKLACRTSDIKINDMIIPNDLISPASDRIRSLAWQVNNAYKMETFDACSLMMRRLLNVLIILMYKKHNSAKRLKSGKYYLTLEQVVEDIKRYNPFGVSLHTIKEMEEFASICDNSVHGLFDNCTQEDIDKNQSLYRFILFDILIASGIIKFDRNEN